MKAAFGNGCGKGCMVYFVALAAIIAITMFGLGGISTRFGANVQQPAGAQNNQVSQPTVGTDPDSLAVAPQADQPQATPNVPLTTNPDPNSVAGGSSLPTPVPPIPTPAVQPTQAASSTTDAAGHIVEVLPLVFTPIEAQGGVITGEASTPFYVVEPGDTLWAIATRLGLDVDALSSVNSLIEDMIYPGQVVYLPQAAKPTPEPQPQPQATSEPQGNQGGQVPSQPVGDTVPTATGANVPQVPDMPNTGINKK